MEWIWEEVEVGADYDQKHFVWNFQKYYKDIFNKNIL